MTRCATAFSFYARSHWLTRAPQLNKYLTETHEQAIAQGALEGLLLTGIDDSGSCVDLLQNYLDRTNDIQTVALLMSQVSTRKVKAPRVEEWIELCVSLYIAAARLIRSE